MLRYWFLMLLPICWPNVAVGSVLESLQKRYQQTTDWQADFEQTTHIGLLDQFVKKHGTLMVKKPGKLRIDYHGGRSYRSNGKTLWILSQGDNQVVVYKDPSQWLAKETLTFLNGLGSLERDFKILSEKTETKLAMLNPQLNLIFLKPKNPDSPLENIVLGVDPKTAQLLEITLHNKSGNRTHYIFSHIKQNLAPKDEIFEFRLEKGMSEVKGI